MKKSNVNKKYPGVYYNKSTNTYYVDSKAKSLDGVYIRIKKSGFTSSIKAYEFKCKEKDRIENNYACVAKSTKSQFEALVEDFLKLESERVSMQTAIKKTRRFNTHIIPIFKNKTIDKITVYDIKEFRSKIATNPNTRNDYKNKILNLFINFIDYLVLYNILAYERANQFKQALTKFDTKMVPKSGCKGLMNFEQFNAFISTFEEHEKKFELLFRTLFQIGARNGEIRGILVECFNPFNNTITLDGHVTSKLGLGKFIRIKGLKTQKEKTCTITQSLSTMLQNWIIEQELKPNDYLFFGKNGKDTPISENSLNNCKKKHLEMADLPFLRIHDFRHSMTTNMLEAGADINAVSDRLGHRSTQITLEVYNHVTESQKDKLQNLLETLYS